MRAGPAIARARAVHIAQSVHALPVIAGVEGWDVEWPSVCRGTNDTRLGVPRRSCAEPARSVQPEYWSPRHHPSGGRGRVAVPTRRVQGQALPDANRLRHAEVSVPDQSGGSLRPGPCPPRVAAAHTVPGHENGVSGRRPDTVEPVLGLDFQARGGGPGRGGEMSISFIPPPLDWAFSWGVPPPSQPLAFWAPSEAGRSGPDRPESSSRRSFAKTCPCTASR